MEIVEIQLSVPSSQCLHHHQQLNRKRMLSEVKIEEEASQRRSRSPQQDDGVQIAQLTSKDRPNRLLGIEGRNGRRTERQRPPCVRVNEISPGDAQLQHSC